MSEPIESIPDRLIREQAPAALMRVILVRQLALGAERLDLAAARDDRELPAGLRYQAHAERTFYRAMAELRQLDKALAKAEPEPDSEPAAPEPQSPPPIKPPTPAAPKKAPRWRSRLHWGPPGDAARPVLIGTDVRADEVLSLLDAGRPETHVLSQFPTLDPEDLDACRAWAAEGRADARAG